MSAKRRFMADSEAPARPAGGRDGGCGAAATGRGRRSRGITVAVVPARGIPQPWAFVVFPRSPALPCFAALAPVRALPDNLLACRRRRGRSRARSPRAAARARRAASRPAPAQPPPAAAELVGRAPRRQAADQRGPGRRASCSAAPGTSARTTLLTLGDTERWYEQDDLVGWTRDHASRTTGTPRTRTLNKSSVGWYRKEFTLPAKRRKERKPSSGRCASRASNYRTKVWLNGKPIGG